MAGRTGVLVLVSAFLFSISSPMCRSLRLSFVLALVLACSPLALFAQQTPADEAPGAALERSMLRSVLETVVVVVRDAALQHEYGTIGDRLQAMASELQAVSQPLTPASPTTQVASQDDLEHLEALLHDLYHELQALRDDATARQDEALAARLDPVVDRLEESWRLAHRLADAEAQEPGELPNVAEARPPSRWLEPGTYDEGRYEPEAERGDATGRSEADDAPRRHSCGEQDWHCGDWYDGMAQRGVMVGDVAYRWPYRETALYRPIPALRYNRVEGLVLGIGQGPLTWGDDAWAKAVGQVGYAFALDRWRYEVGLETRLSARHNTDYGLKVGGAYRRNTATNDLWKSNWIENSLAAVLFENDFFDYYEVEGWTAYAVQRLSPYLQVSAGFRGEDYHSLTQNTSWSLFGGDGFRWNPAVREGRMHSFNLALDGGRVRGLDYLPRGVAFRLEAELGQGLGGDFSFNRYLGDVRFYMPAGRENNLSFRLRGALATGDVPFQKTFSLGGIGTVRAYPQNLFYGTRMLLGNVEYAASALNFFDWADDILVFGFAEAGWVNYTGRNRLDADTVLPAAGVGLSLGDRALRLELAWPLRDLGTGHDPTLWLRLNPTF